MLSLHSTLEVQCKIFIQKKNLLSTSVAKVTGYIANGCLTYILAIKFGVKHQCVKQVPPRHVGIHELVMKHLQTVYWLISY